MFLMFFLTVMLFFQTVFTAEGLIGTIVGALVATGVTQIIKRQTGAGGFTATILAYAISFAVALAAFVGATYLNGGSLTFAQIAAASAQIFTLATVAYRAISSATQAAEGF